MREWWAKLKLPIEHEWRTKRRGYGERDGDGRWEEREADRTIYIQGVSEIMAYFIM